MAKSGSLTAGYWYADNGQTRGYTLGWSASQSIANNQSTITWWVDTAGTYPYTVAERTLVVTLAGQTLINKSDRVMRGAGRVASGSFTVTHDSYGNKSISGSIQAAVYTSAVNCSNSATFNLDSIPRRAEITSAPDFTNLDNPIIKYNNPAGFKVNTWIEINPTNTHLCIRENIGNGGNYTYELTDDEREALIRCCTKDTATVRFGMYTYNGTTLIGTHYVDKTFTLTKDIIPTANVTLSDAEGNFDKYGKYIQGQSKLHVSIAAEGVYGSTIKSYKTTFDGKTFTEAEFTTDAIIGKDELDLEIVVTDSRGRTCTLKESIAVYEYKPPKIISISAKRCQKHNVNELGNDYLGVVFNSEVTSLDSQNSVKYELDYKKVTEDSYTTVSLSDYTNMYEVEGHAIFAADNDAYNIILRITDDFGTVEKKTNGPSISVLTSRLKYNLGLAFGKLAELAGVFDIGFKTRFHGGILQMVLEEGADLNEQLTPNTFTLKEIGEAEYLNLPNEVTEGTGALTIVECGENIICHILRVFHNGKTMQYERYYFEDEWHAWASELDKKHPVNSLYISEDETSPAELFGGTWQRIEGRFLYGCTSTETVGLTGGSSTHKHNDGTLIAAIGSGFGRADTLAFCAGSTDHLAGHSPTYTLQAPTFANNGWSHSTAVYGYTGESSTLPPHINLAVWKRIA